MNPSAKSLLLHNDYNTTHCAVAQGTNILVSTTLPNRQAASHLIPTLADVFEKAPFRLFDCDAIVAHRGPAPFTTLRTVISTANGLSYATSIPLIGVDGIQAFAWNTDAPECEYTLVLLHAFRDDVYYGLYDERKQAHLYGWASFDTFHERLLQFVHKLSYTPHIYMIGNGVIDRFETLAQQTAYQAYIPDDLPHCASIADIAAMAHEQWQTEKTHRMLTPLYLKQSQAYIHP